jgi:succinate dehydrogenase hydrophobic anchor subunit
MQLDKTPMFRKNTVSWYKSRWFCIAASLLAICLVFFGIIGIRVALYQNFRTFVWVPALLAAAALVLFLFMVYRACKASER